ncbi:MAG: hypothetical protein ABSC08_06460 [Bryobacteraceae bacterium]|jgi:hypothetical protein
MPVFDKATKVGRKVKDPLTDKTLPNGKALSYGAMTTPAALAGTTGNDCKLVHGDRWQEIAGNMTEHYTLDVKTTIDQNWNTTVNQDWTIAVNGIMNLTVVQGYNEVEQGPVNRTYWQVVNDTFQMDHNVSVPDSAAFQCAKYANTWTSNEAVAIVGGFQMALCIGLCLTIAPTVDLEYKTLHAEYHLLHGDGKLVELYAVEAKLKIGALISKIKTGLHIKASANAGVDADAATPVT